MADRVVGKLVESIADMLSDACARILQDADAAEVFPVSTSWTERGD
jgi:hypothetical protein